MSVQLRAVSFDALDPAALGAFWAGVLGREIVEEDGGVLLPGDETQVGLRFVGAASQAGPRNRLHLHVTSQTADSQRHTVETALRLGASRPGTRPLHMGRDIYLTDPGGNEFCVIEPGNTYLAGCGLLGEVTCDGSRDASLFWRDTLEWEIVWDQDEQIAIQSPQGGTKIAWDTWPEAPTEGRDRQRFELKADDVDVEVEVERLLGLGATALGRREGAMALADPDGNEFSITSGEQQGS